MAFDLFSTARIEQILTDIVLAVRSLTPQSQQTWTSVTFQNSWVNFGGAFYGVAYMKDAEGFVHLRGMAKSGTSGAAIFTLPPGYRPSSTIYSLNANGGGTGFAGIVSIDTSGVVKNDSGTNTYQSFDNVYFKADA